MRCCSASRSSGRWRPWARRRASRSRSSRARGRAGTSARTRARPTAPRTPARCVGVRGLAYAVEDIARACEAGIRSFLIADAGLLDVLRDMQRADELPRDCVWKISVMMAPSNPPGCECSSASARLPSTSRPIPPSYSYPRCGRPRIYHRSLRRVARRARRRRAWQRGGRPHRRRRPAVCEVRSAQLTRALSVWEHLVADACAIAREKVHRAAVALEWLRGSHPSSSSPHRTRPASASPSRGQNRSDRRRIMYRKLLIGVLVAAIAVTAASVAFGASSRGAPRSSRSGTTTAPRAMPSRPTSSSRPSRSCIPISRSGVVSQPADNYFALLQSSAISQTSPDLATMWTGLFDLKYAKFLLNLKPYFTAPRRASSRASATWRRTSTSRTASS